MRGYLQTPSLVIKDRGAQTAICGLAASSQTATGQMPQDVIDTLPLPRKSLLPEQSADLDGVRHAAQDFCSGANSPPGRPVP